MGAGQNITVSLDVLQTNAAVSPGNSGGGLFNAQGETDCTYTPDSRLFMCAAAGLISTTEISRTAPFPGDSDNIQLAETVYAVGNPGGTLSGSITDGIISATSRTISISIESSAFATSTAGIILSSASGVATFWMTTFSSVCEFAR